jgi:chromosome segregation protein
MNAVQAEVYRVGAEIARVEQQIQHNRELAEQLERTRHETERAHGELAEHIAADRMRFEELGALLADAAPQLEGLHEADEAAAEALRAAETRLAEWQTLWDQHTQATSQAAQSAEVERTRLDYLDKQCLAADQRRNALEAERSATNLDDLGQALAALDGEHGGLREQVEVHTATVEERRHAAEAALEQERATHTALSRARGDLENLRGRLGSLEALQHAALGDTGGAVQAWLQDLGLGDARRLGETLQVDTGWERAVETVLDGWLESVLVKDAGALTGDLDVLGQADLVLMDARVDGADVPADSLAARVRGPVVALALLARVRSSESIAAAHAMVSALAPGESLITPEGEWIGPGFVRVQRGGGNQVGVIAREREIRELGSRIGELEREIAAHGESLDRGKQERLDAERMRDDAQRELYTAHRRLAEIGGQLQSHRGRMDSAQERLNRVAGELEDVVAKLDADREQVREARGRLETAVTHMGELEQRRQDLDGERRKLLEMREEARMNAREARETAHQLALSTESRRTAAASLEQSLQRMHGQLTQFEARRSEIATQLMSSGDPLAGLEGERQTHLNQRLLVDRQMVEARQAVQEQDTELRRLEQARHAFEQALNEQREQVAQLRLHEQEHRLRAQALGAAIAEAGFEVQALFEALPGEADAGQWQGDLAELEQKIRRLEPVNLAAIQEYEEQSQRKTYLDAQLTDLSTALETLEGAIRKIDKETRARFKETFDRVNTGVQELFPRLFGGGHAHLEMTGDDLLSTGVTIMARPPGKRVSSISLLSGGEKAMTAVAMVFAIFRLNPAPFCLLDEVDAPLDEANVGRFSSLVVEMSAQVQFIFVTHNKATMEAARQLCGVTMREPGVSRLVQVDLAEAAKLAGAA